MEGLLGYHVCWCNDKAETRFRLQKYDLSMTNRKHTTVISIIIHVHKYDYKEHIVHQV